MTICNILRIIYNVYDIKYISGGWASMEYLLTDNKKEYNGKILKQLKQKSGLEAMSGYIENIDSLKSDRCIIGEKVLILGNATIKHVASLGNINTQIETLFQDDDQSLTIISDNAEVCGNSIVDQGTQLMNNASVCNAYLIDCIIAGNTYVNNSQLERTLVTEDVYINKCRIQDSQISGHVQLDNVNAKWCSISGDVSLSFMDFSYASITKKTDIVTCNDILDDDTNKIDLYVYRSIDRKAYNWTNNTILAHVYQEKINPLTKETEILTDEVAVGVITENGIEETYNANMYNISSICEPETKDLFVSLVKKAMNSLLASSCGHYEI